MHEFNVIATAVGGLILLLALGSKRLATSPFPPTLLALMIGVVIGPEMLGWIDPQALGNQTSILELAARLTLGIALVGVALRVPSEFQRAHWRSVLVLVGLGMPLMWAGSTLLIYLILGLPFWLAALIGAAITPTDPVAATSVVTRSLAERMIPEQVRHTISLESGVNDGLAYLFVFLPFLLLTRPAGEALGHWFASTLLWEVVAGTLFGLALGWVAGKLLNHAEQADLVDSDWRLAYTVALALLAVGLGRLIGTDEILFVFAAGAGFDQVVSSEDRENEELGQEAVNRFFSIPIFALIGTAIPWAGWGALGWSGMALAIAVLLLRRPPVLLLLRRRIPTLQGRPEALFAGWFGPIAVSAVYYAIMMEHRLGEPLVWHVVSLVVCASVVLHGLSGAPLTRLLGRKTQRG